VHGALGLGARLKTVKTSIAIHRLDRIRQCCGKIVGSVGNFFPGNSKLYDTSERGNVAEVRRLLDGSADPNGRALRGDNAINSAASPGNDGGRAVRRNRNLPMP
jgi:hypothetical protein